MKRHSGFCFNIQPAKIIPALITVAAVFSSCALPSLRPVWSDFEVKNNEVLVVGKIEFNPPLSAEGRELRAAADDEVSWDTLWIICGNKMRAIDRKKLSPDSEDFRKKIIAAQGNTFYYACDGRPFYCIAGSFYKNIHRLSTNRGVAGEFEAILLPAGFYVDVKPGDEAVYIGTIRYFLDSAYNTVKIEIIDEYDREMPVFRRIFGAVRLKKALVKPLRLKAVLNPESSI